MDLARGIATAASLFVLIVTIVWSGLVNLAVVAARGWARHALRSGATLALPRGLSVAALIAGGFPCVYAAGMLVSLSGGTIRPVLDVPCLIAVAIALATLRHAALVDATLAALQSGPDDFRSEPVGARTVLVRAGAAVTPWAVVLGYLALTA